MEDEGTRLVVKEVSPQSTSFTWSAKIEVVVHEVQDVEGSREISLNGSITGMGPIQKGHLRGQVGALKNKIVLAAQDSKPSTESIPSSGDLSGELARLSDLHQSGALTEEEFAQAKARLLGT